jgi:hypothetical protein
MPNAPNQVLIAVLLIKLHKISNGHSVYLGPALVYNVHVMVVVACIVIFSHGFVDNRRAVDEVCLWLFL